MRTTYKFCSICGARLKKEKNGNLACTRCDFVNYRNARPTATGLVFWKNKLLLTQRKNGPFRGWWDLPGGFIDRGETPEKALSRELFEELGLRVKKMKFFGHFDGTYPSATDPFYVLTAVYLVIPAETAIQVFDRQELSDTRWFSKKEIPAKIAFDSNQRVIKEFLKIWRE